MKEKRIFGDAGGWGKKNASERGKRPKKKILTATCFRGETQGGNKISLSRTRNKEEKKS